MKFNEQQLKMHLIESMIEQIKRMTSHQKSSSSSQSISSSSSQLISSSSF